MIPAKALDTLVAHLTSLYEEGGTGNYLIASDGPYYIQVGAKKGIGAAFLEAVSNIYLEGEHVLDSGQKTAILGLGLKEQLDGNFVIPFDNSAPEARHELANTALQLFEVYGVDVSAIAFDLNLDDTWELRNPELNARIEGGDMHEIAKALCEATLFLPHQAGTGTAGLHRDANGAIVLLTDEDAIKPYARSLEVELTGAVGDALEQLRWMGPNDLILNPFGPYTWKMSAEDVRLLLEMVDN